MLLLNMAKLEWCCNYMNYHTVQIWQRFSYTHILYMKTILYMYYIYLL